eukprot:6517546-Prymnesium_polylepis.1
MPVERLSTWGVGPPHSAWTASATAPPESGSSLAYGDHVFTMPAVLNQPASGGGAAVLPRRRPHSAWSTRRRLLRRS